METFGCVKAVRAPGPPPDLSFNGFGMLFGHFFGVFSWFWDAFGHFFRVFPWLWDGFRVVSSCFVKLALRLVPYLFFEIV